MSGRLNPQAPGLKLKDSLKKEAKLQEHQIQPLHCYDEKELSIIELYGSNIKKLQDLPYMERLGIAKWFKKQHALTENIVDLLNIDKYYLEFGNSAKLIDPVEKRYMTEEELKLLGITYVKPKPKEESSKLVQNKHQNLLNIYSKNKVKRIKIKNKKARS